MRLQFKILRVVLLILAVSAVFSGALMFYSLRQSTIVQFRQTAIIHLGAIEGSLQQGMMSGRQDITQQAIQSVAEQEMVTGVQLIAPNGSVAASSSVSELNTKIDGTPFQQVMNTGELTTGIEGANGKSQLWIISPVLNHAECQSCHDPGKDILGAIKVSLDATTLNAQATHLTLYLVLIGGATFLVLAASLSFAIRKTVLKPILGLASTAKLFSGGDFSARATARKDDEIGMLAGTFNQMADRVEQRTRELEESRLELANWNTDLEKKVEQRTAQLAAMNDVITTLSQSLDLKKILKATLDRILARLDLTGGAIYLFDHQRERLDLFLQRNFTPAALDRITPHLPSELSVDARKPAVYDLTESKNRSNSSGENGLALRSLAVIPISSSTNGVLGTLSLASSDQGRFDAETMRLLGSMVEAMAIAIENSLAAHRVAEINEIREELLQKLIVAQEDERRRIARELHDDASQSLAALVLHLEDVSNKLPPKSAEARQRIGTLREWTIETLNRVRGLALELRPSVLDDLGLNKAIEWYARDYMAKPGIEVSVKTTGPKIDLAQYAETMLFRVAQEAMANAVRHAHPTKIEVILDWNETGVSMQIRDNGDGFDVQEAMSGETGQRHLGIHGMSERVALLGGSFKIESQPGLGTTISARIPLTRGSVVNG